MIGTARNRPGGSSIPRRPDVRSGFAHLLRLGLTDYPDALALQQRLHARVADGALEGVLMLLEHPHVYTLGRRGPDEHILAPPAELDRLSAQVYRTNRGGEATYHGPGQLVGYPILNLRSWGSGPLEYVRTLERTISATLADFGIAAESEGRPTGVWTDGAKIAAIGVRVSRGVTTHGFALNVSPDLSYFDHVIPCGIEGCRVTSMAAEGAAADVDAVASRLAGRFRQSFGISLAPARLDHLSETL